MEMLRKDVNLASEINPATIKYIKDSKPEDGERIEAALTKYKKSSDSVSRKKIIAVVLMMFIAIAAVTTVAVVGGLGAFAVAAIGAGIFAFSAIVTAVVCKSIEAERDIDNTILFLEIQRIVDLAAYKNQGRSIN